MKSDVSLFLFKSFREKSRNIKMVNTMCFPYLGPWISGNFAERNSFLVSFQFYRKTCQIVKLSLKQDLVFMALLSYLLKIPMRAATLSITFKFQFSRFTHVF